jgi:dipeptidyl-peptidase-4
MMNKKMSLLAIFFVLGFSLFSLAHSQEKINIPLLFDTKILSKISTPEYIWLSNGKVLLLDSRIEPENRTLELLDPQTGKRTPAVEVAIVLATLKELIPEGALSFLRWPDALNPNGKGAAYILAGDLFFVNFENSEVKRLTKTRSEETSVTFSPDGLWVSFIRDNDLYAIDLKSGNQKRLTKGATETLLNGPLSWVYWEEIYEHSSVPYAWSPDSKAIAYLQTDDSPVPISTFVNFKPATQGVVRQHYPKAGQANPKVRLGIVDVNSAETTWVDCGSYEYLARFNWLPISQEIAVQILDRKQSTLRLFFADRLTGKSREILVEKQPAWINLHNSLYFLKDRKRFIWLSERDGYQHLYLYKLDGRLIAQLTKGEFMVVPADGDIVMDNGGLVGVDEKRGWVYFTSNQNALKDKHLCKVKLDGKGLKKLSAGDGVHALSFSPDLNYYLDTYSSSSQLPEFTLYKADGTKIATITPSAKEVLDRWNLIYPEFATFKTDDGLDLPAMMVKPKNFDKTKKYPAIIYVYGGPGSQQVINKWNNRILWHNLLAQEGFFVFVFEVRAGMGKSKALETSVHKQAYGMQNVKDILAGVAWLKQMPSIDPKRLGIWGGSGGGCTTLFTMTHSDVFKAGISLYPVSDWHFYDTIYTERYQSTPQDNPQGYKETSSVLAASNLKGRLLIVHGTYDDNVHPQNTEAFINALIEKNIPFELMIYPWRKHGIGDYPARVHLYTLMLDFWKKNL